jgi:hypothetical protein
MCSVQRIKTKCGVLCNNKPLLWFFAKEAPTNGVIRYFLCIASLAAMFGNDILPTNPCIDRH